MPKSPEEHIPPHKENPIPEEVRNMSPEEEDEFRRDTEIGAEEHIHNLEEMLKENELEFGQETNTERAKALQEIIDDLKTKIAGLKEGNEAHT